MRIGIDASNLSAGGGITHLVELLAHAGPEANDVKDIVVFGAEATLARLPQRSWLRTVGNDAIEAGPARRVTWQRTALTSELRRERCDVLFVPGGSYLGSFRPYAAMCRNMLPFDRREMWRYAYAPTFFRLSLLRFVQAASFRRAAGVIFLTEYAHGAVTERIGQLTRCCVIPHGVSERFRGAERAQLPIESYSADRPFRFLYTSIIDLYKHQWNVAEATLRLRRQGLPVVLELAGPAYGPAMKKLQRVLSSTPGAREVVELRGHVSHAELPALYRRADAFVFASTCENMPNILIEAMASGLPIASSAAGPMPEILRDGGLYFNPEDTQSIELALRRFLLDPELRKRKARRASELAAQYSWERCAHETFRFLAEVASRTDGGAAVG